ncbi:hypothetical protein KQY30_29040 [Streptomyces sp. GMY02]|uniref:hypothetical protein n=1 Tax=Streptomyces sp. GMY02 TaxID=1333528 RepID=UPI001C2BF1F3|nr:hypothetical protein [Streptomyces sp. GMY02]QXE37671.1 hypothetical protein KQY30_29040 [Streptomyces sp. GMY02]
MDNSHTQREHPGPESSPTRVTLGPFEHEATLAAFVGREFTVALTEGLRRARVTSRTKASGDGAPPVRRPAPERAPGVSLLAEHSGAILRHFEKTLLTVPALSVLVHHRTRFSVGRWARQVLAAACRTERPAGRDVPPFPRGAAHQHAVAISLLIESATLTLPPDAPDCLEVIRALARAGGLTGAGSAQAPRAARAARSVPAMPPLLPGPA